VGIECSPSIDNNLPHIGLIVAIGIFQKQEVGRLRNNDAPVNKCQAGGNVKLISKYRELIGLAITIGIFTYFNAVVAHTFFIANGVGIVYSFNNPKPSLLIPIHGNGVDDIRL
jgi:hypothetical protein